MTEEALTAVLEATGPVLLDFDGPVCRLYPGDLNARASQYLRDQLREAGIGIPEDLECERDPLALLRLAGDLGRAELVRATDQALAAIEVGAVPSALVTDGAADFMRACADTGRPLVIVSNNAAEAIETFLARHGFSGLVSATVGREHGRPDHMKPNPWAVATALKILKRPPGQCVLVGDSVTDIEVSQKVGLRSVAYVKTPERWERLAAMHPDALTLSMATLADALRQVGGAPTLRQ
jgi:phosphoglycolate phosphatase-like HAD superfamily hydrolase